MKPERLGGKSIKASAISIFLIYIIWHQSDITLPTLKQPVPPPSRLPQNSLQDFNSNWPQLAKLRLWSEWQSFHVFMNPCKAYFHQRVRPGLHRPTGRRNRVRSEASLSNLEGKTEKSCSLRKATMAPQNILGSSLRASLLEASCCLMQPISLNILQMYVSVSGPEICSVIQKPQCISSVWDLGVTKQNRLWKIALPQRKLLKWPSPHPHPPHPPHPSLIPQLLSPSSSPPLPALKADGKTGSLQAHSDAQPGDKQTKCRLSVAKWFATAKTVPALGVCRGGGCSEGSQPAGRLTRREDSWKRWGGKHHQSVGGGAKRWSAARMNLHQQTVANINNEPRTIVLIE